MDVQQDTTRKQGAESRQQSHSDDPKRDMLAMEPQGERSTGVLPDRGITGPSAPSVLGSSGGASASAATDGGKLATSPLGQMHKLIERAGEEPFPSEIIQMLSQPIDDSLVDIRPDGLIYVSHPHYRDRLDAAFGVGAWALVPLATPQIRDNRVVYYGFLKARGQYIGDAVGGAQYYPNNSQGSYDNSVEAAKSDCLVRCCKALPMFRECWDKEYAAYWVATYAEQGVTSQSNGRKVWKKKGIAMRDFTLRPDRQSVGEYARPSRIQDENKAHIDAIATEGTLRLAARDLPEEHEPDYDPAQEAYEAEKGDF